ncbi:two-component system sensor histidine kinase DesK [Rhodococcus sp. SORGH_AS 301]|nr:two-component system sensor histidine kinase DesK [Rhodococcus sp. SORGH_AS_0301]
MAAVSRTTAAALGRRQGLVQSLRSHFVIEPREVNVDDSEGTRLRAAVRRGWVFSAVWLAYLIYPVRAVWSYDGPVHWQVAAALCLLAFAAVFLGGFRDFRGRLHAEAQVRVPRQWAVVVALMLLLVPVAPAAGDSVLTGCVFVAVLAVMTLPRRSGLLVLAANVAAVEVLPRVVPSWTPDDSAGFTVAVAAFAAWGISQLVARNIQLTEARRRLSDLAVVEERERVARDVHDILGHSLTVITMKAELAGRLVEVDPARAAVEIADVESLSRAALADVRSTVGGLRHLRLDTEIRGVRSAVEAAGMTLHIEGSVRDVAEELRELFAWALREAVTNVVRHSGGTECRVRLDARRITVADNGIGPQGESTGTGLRGLTDRADALGAAVRVARGSDGGFTLTVTAP